jgi:diguanylate cyclase (GGDEF)-like protein
MKQRRLNRATVFILALVGFFWLMLFLAASILIQTGRQTRLDNSEAQAVRFVSGAETSLNRSLLSVDVLLAGMDDLLGLSQAQVNWVDGKSASRLLRSAVQQNLLVSALALLDADARVMASSGPGAADEVFDLPKGFIDSVLDRPISVLMISAPGVSLASAERVLYFARHITLGDGARVIALAELQIPRLIAIMIQGVDISGLEVTLERNNGELLANAPPLTQRLGEKLVPPLNAEDAPPNATRMAARISGLPALVVTRPTLYSQVLIAASIPLDAALESGRTEGRFIAGTALLYALMVLAAGALAIWYVDRLAQARRTIAVSKGTLDQALESMVSGFVLLNAQDQVVSCNRRFIEIFPWMAGQVEPGTPFRQVLEVAARNHLPQGDAKAREDWITRRLALQVTAHEPHEQLLSNGRTILITERRTPNGGMVIVYEDVTELRQATAEIKQLAFFDPLTQLPNRRLLMDRMQQAMAAIARSGRYGALLFMDLDHFKKLNDSLGHDVGDLLLQQVAQRLKDCVRNEDTVARLGGDEFVIMLEDLSQHSHEAAALAQRVGEKLLHQLNKPYQLGIHVYHCTPSVGAALYGQDQQSPLTLLKQADIAMYQVKSQGRNGLCFFDPQMQAAINTRTQIERDLRAALQCGEFELYYQPQLAWAGEVVGAEALIRWRHPVRGLVSPAEFIPVAEECELIVPLGQWVLRTACRQLAAWQNDPQRSELRLSVNVSARQFRQRDFVAQVVSVLRETAIASDRLKLELTESLVLDNVEDSIAKMSELKAVGVGFSVDDFGTGHSSLAYLTRLPLAQLKIDQSFVRNIGIRESDGMMVQAIIGMARNLGLEVIAEGVETTAQQEFLALHGCNLYQGYLFGRPTPLAEFEALLSRVNECIPS